MQPRSESFSAFYLWDTGDNQHADSCNSLTGRECKHNLSYFTFTDQRTELICLGWMCAGLQAFITCWTMLVELLSNVTQRRWKLLFILKEKLWLHKSWWLSSLPCRLCSCTLALFVDSSFASLPSISFPTTLLYERIHCIAAVWVLRNVDSAVVRWLRSFPCDNRSLAAVRPVLFMQPLEDHCAAEILWKPGE